MKILITAGPTIEPLDPVRYISNRSTGAMGYEIAKKAREKGFDVCLVSGPVALAPPDGVKTIKVNTAREMRDSVMERIDDYDCIIMAAAVCDFRPEETEEQKIKKSDELTLNLVSNPDILAGLSEKENLLKVGFALETENALENGSDKLKRKNLDLIVINVISAENDPFGPNHPSEGAQNRRNYTLIDSGDKAREVNGATKDELAEFLIDEIGKL
ncbi:MAG: hypothetical protein HQ594_05885 [Candidatus Omnitrophica bacterium]|nr:hypothetical protein [Candidatus Omnitrophota bacterium]